eukprot:gb/GECG01002718.1/.p1 GENE.gb/GECG01002718.1/~~gb/GECG01002718.1/.p1  ORF type:complete len:115 (+),score=11.03 gb/GECG01002718.1/:1-345(+)
MYPQKSVPEDYLKDVLVAKVSSNNVVVFGILIMFLLLCCFSIGLSAVSVSHWFLMRCSACPSTNSFILIMVVSSVNKENITLVRRNHEGTRIMTTKKPNASALSMIPVLYWKLF